MKERNLIPVASQRRGPDFRGTTIVTAHIFAGKNWHSDLRLWVQATTTTKKYRYFNIEMACGKKIDEIRSIPISLESNP